MRRFSVSAVSAVLGLTLALGVGPGCSRNPATGRLQAFLMSEEEEILLGQEVDEEIRRSIPLYEEPKVVALVESVGKKIAAASERPTLPWTFRVLDDPSVNAFALPGGYIYVTRGLLAHLNTVDELAAVLGHEAGHVTARHSAVQLRKRNTARATVGLFRIIDPNLRHIGGIAAGTAGLVLLKYSRDDEIQADDLALRYTQKTGYDPRAIPEVFMVLSSVATPEGRVPTYLSTHPEPEVRHARMAARIGATGIDEVDPTYLAAIEGMVYGNDPRDGFFAHERFVHPRMGFQIDIPSGWKAENGPQQVLAISPDEKALWMLGPTQHEDHRQALADFFAAGEFAQGQVWNGAFGGHPATSAAFTAPTDTGALSGLIAFVQYGDAVLAMLAVSDADSWTNYAGPISESFSSFGNANEALASAEPMRIETFQPAEATTLKRLHEQRGGPLAIHELTRLNHVEPDEQLQAGRPIKWVTGFRGAQQSSEPPK